MIVYCKEGLEKNVLYHGLWIKIHTRKKELKLIYVLAIKADRNNLLVKVYCK